MNTSQKNVSAAVAAVLGSTGLMNVASAGDLQFTFADHLNSAWGAGREFAMTT